MKNSQRWLIVVSLFLLALASAAYCLDYRTYNFYRISGNLIDGSDLSPTSEIGPSLFAHSKFPPAPIIGFGEVDRLPTWDQAMRAARTNASWGEFLAGQQRVTFSGLYPRPGMTFEAALIGGLLFPALLIVAACYLVLGLPRVDSKIEVPASAASAEIPLHIVVAGETPDEGISPRPSEPATEAPSRLMWAPTTTLWAIQKLWRGQYSLAKSFWGFLILGTFLLPVVTTLMLVAMASVLVTPAQKVLPLLMLELGVVAYEVVAIVGTWRSANRVMVEKGRKGWHAGATQLFLCVWTLGLIGWASMGVIKWISPHSSP